VSFWITCLRAPNSPLPVFSTRAARETTGIRQEHRQQRHVLVLGQRRLRPDSDEHYEWVGPTCGHGLELLNGYLQQRRDYVRLLFERGEQYDPSTRLRPRKTLPIRCTSVHPATRLRLLEATGRGGNRKNSRIWPVG